MLTINEFLTNDFFTQTQDLNILQKNRVDDYEADKLQFRQLEDLDDVEVFRTIFRKKYFKISSLLYHIELYNPQAGDESFMNKIEEIERDVIQQSLDVEGLVEIKMDELDKEEKELSPERIQQFYQFEADESHVGNQCQVCLEDIEVGRLMKQLDCGGRHSFCSDCIDKS